MVAMKDVLDDVGARTADETAIRVVAAVRAHQADVLVSLLRDGSGRLYRVIE
jgi:phage terminase large subunit-like protein